MNSEGGREAALGLRGCCPDRARWPDPGMFPFARHDDSL